MVDAGAAGVHEPAVDPDRKHMPDVVFVLGGEEREIDELGRRVEREAIAIPFDVDAAGDGDREHVLVALDAAIDAAGGLIRARRARAFERDERVARGGRPRPLLRRLEENRRGAGPRVVVGMGEAELPGIGLAVAVGVERLLVQVVEVVAPGVVGEGDDREDGRRPDGRRRPRTCASGSPSRPSWETRR